MTIDKFEEGFKELIEKWKEGYKANHEKDPENWPMDIGFPEFYEDFSVWMELTGENL